MNHMVRKVLSSVKLVSAVEPMAAAVIATVEEQILAELQQLNMTANRQRLILRSMADDIRTTARVSKRMLGDEFRPTTLPERDPDGNNN